MLDRGSVMPFLLDSCPGLRPAWERHVAEDDDRTALYVDLGWLACEILERARARHDQDLVGLFTAIEHLHTEGDAHVREAATIGLLEGLQNFTAQDPELRALVECHLGPESRRWWASLESFWGGRIPFVGADLVQGSG